MTALVLTGVVCLLLGIAIGRFRSYPRGVEHGRRLTEIEHGWVPPLTPGAHKARGSWRLVDRQFTATNERPPVARHR